MPMHSAYPLIFIATVTTTALTRVTRQIAQQLLVPTTNFSAQTVGRTELQNVLQNHSFATENVTAKMGLTRRQRARRLHALLWDVSINVGRRLPEVNVIVHQDEHSRTTTEPALILMNALNGDIVINSAQTQTVHMLVFAHLVIR